MKRFFALMVQIFVVVYGFGEVRLTTIFTDNMVIQANAEAPVWGKADVGERVRVIFDGQMKETVADGKGKWSVTLKTGKYNKVPQDMTIEGTNRIVLKNILIGDIWFCSGQSNMEWDIKRSTNAEAIIANSEMPELRFINIDVDYSDTEKDEFKNATDWVVASPKNIGELSGVGYFFAKELMKELDIPIGLIVCAVGGASMQTYMSKEYIEKSQYKEHFYGTDKFIENQVKKRKSNVKPAKFPKRQNNPHMMTCLSWNGTIASMRPMAMKGILWYQGECNARYIMNPNTTERAEEYIELSKIYCEMMRKEFNNPEMPFYFVMLAGFTPKDQNFVAIREAQRRFLNEELKMGKRTGLASAVDLGLERDIHPRDKEPVGIRLALNALATTYGKDVEYMNPQPKEICWNGDKLSIVFSNCNKGLISESSEIKGFEVCLKDGKGFMWKPVKARLDGKDRITLEVPYNNGLISKIRFAYKGYPDTHIYDADKEKFKEKWSINNMPLPILPFVEDLN